MDAQEHLFSRAYRRPRVLHLPWTIKFEGMGHWKRKGRGLKKIHTRKNSREKKFIQPEQGEKTTYKLIRRKNMHTRQPKYDIYNYS